MIGRAILSLHRWMALRRIPAAARGASYLSYEYLVPPVATVERVTIHDADGGPVLNFCQTSEGVTRALTRRPAPADVEALLAWLAARTRGQRDRVVLALGARDGANLKVFARQAGTGWTCSFSVVQLHGSPEFRGLMRDLASELHGRWDLPWFDTGAYVADPQEGSQDGCAGGEGLSPRPPPLKTARHKPATPFCLDPTRPARRAV